MRKWMIVFLAAAWIGAGCAEAASVLAQVGYTIQRSDSTKPGAHNEFTGGTHTFYPELDRRDSWLEQHVEKLRTMRSYKRGWTRVFFDWPQRVRESSRRAASGCRFMRARIMTSASPWSSARGLAGPSRACALSFARRTRLRLGLWRCAKPPRAQARANERPRARRARRFPAFLRQSRP